MRKLLSLIILLIIVNPLTTATAESTDNTYSIDGAPIAVMLINELNSIYSLNYTEATRIAKTALQINLTSNLQYIHRTTWTTLLRLAQTLENMSISGIKERSLIIELYRYKLELEEVLPQYTSSLLHNIKDPTLRMKYNKIFREYINNFDENIERVIKSAITGQQQRIVKTIIYINETVYAGKTIPILINITPALHVEVIRLTLRLVSGVLLNATTYYINKTIDQYIINLTIPDTSIGAYSIKGVDVAELTIALNGVYNGSSINLITSKTITIHTIRPKLYFEIPSIITVGEKMTLKVISHANDTLNLNVSITPSNNNTIILNKIIDIKPGENTITLNTSSLQEGLYTISFTVMPKGSYIKETYSKVFAVSSRNLINIEAPSLVVGPPFSIVLNIRLNKLNASKIIIETRGESIEEPINNYEGVIRVQIPLNWILLESNEKIIVKAVSLEGTREIKSTVEIPVINILTIIIIAILGFSITTISAQGLAASLEGFTRRVARLQRREGLKPSSYKDLLYNLIALLSRITPPPARSETLREYYKRVTGALAERMGDSAKRASSILWRFIRHYEELLYSPRKPELKQLRKLYDRIVSMLRW